MVMASPFGWVRSGKLEFIRHGLAAFSSSLAQRQGFGRFGVRTAPALSF